MIRSHGTSWKLAVGCSICVVGLGSGRDESVAGRTDEKARIDAIRRTGDRLIPLHETKRPPRAGDWLAQHRERGQTFDAYVRSDPNRPTPRLTTLYIQPLGTFTPAQQLLVDATRELLSIHYHVPVRLLEPIDLATIPAQARRVHPEWNVPQILTRHVLNRLKARRPADAVAVLALTTSDLWPGPGWNFVFGEASLGERVGIWSINRLGDPEREPAVCLKRTLQIATHETGHMLGIPHCTAYECGMNGANHQAESDAQPLWFCPDDERKLWWACGMEPRARFARLARFARAHGLETEARFWERSRAALAGQAGEPKPDPDPEPDTDSGTDRESTRP